MLVSQATYSTLLTLRSELSQAIYNTFLLTPVAFPSNLQHAVDVGDGMLLNSDLHGNADQDVDVD